MENVTYHELTVEFSSNIDQLISISLLNYLEINGIPTFFISKGKTDKEMIIKNVDPIQQIQAQGVFDNNDKISYRLIFKKLDPSGSGRVKISPHVAEELGIATKETLDKIEKYTYQIGIIAREFFLSQFLLFLKDYDVNFGYDENKELIVCSTLYPKDFHLVDKHGNEIDFYKKFNDVVN